jgi:hypothetical protein
MYAVAIQENIMFAIWNPKENILTCPFSEVENILT